MSNYRVLNIAVIFNSMDACPTAYRFSMVEFSSIEDLDQEVGMENKL